MITTLNRYRRDLQLAEIEDDLRVAEKAYRGIETMREVIRRHRVEHGLPLPKDVLEGPEGVWK